MLSVKQGHTKYHFCVFGIIRPGIEPWSPGPLANTLLIRPKTMKKACGVEKNQNRQFINDLHIYLQILLRHLLVVVVVVGDQIKNRSQFFKIFNTIWIWEILSLPQIFISCHFVDPTLMCWSGYRWKWEKPRFCGVTAWFQEIGRLQSLLHYWDVFIPIENIDVRYLNKFI